MTTHCSSSTPQSLFSPSFAAHSSHRLEDIAARVIRELELSNEENPDGESDFNPIYEEFWAENGELDSGESGFQEELQSDRVIRANPDGESDFNPICEEFWAENGELDTQESGFQEELQRDDGRFEGKEEDDNEEQEFAFPLISRDWVSSPVSRYPVFDTDLLLEAEVIMDRNYKEEEEKRPLPEKVIRLPLRMLFEAEREKKAEIDELNGIPVGTYCVWKPKKVEEVEEGRRWSKNSSSKRWKWPDLIHRSSSDVGKGRFVILDPVKGEDKKKVEKKAEKSKMAAVSAEKLAEHGGDKRRWVWSGSFRKQLA